MNKFLASFTFIIILVSCSNTTDMETGEIRTLQLLKKAFDSSNKYNRFIDARNLISQRANRCSKYSSNIRGIGIRSKRYVDPIPRTGRRADMARRRWCDHYARKRYLKSVKRDGRRLNGIFLLHATLVTNKRKNQKSIAASFPTLLETIKFLSVFLVVNLKKPTVAKLLKFGM